jgi:hypothetical protein
VRAFSLPQWLRFARFASDLKWLRSAQVRQNLRCQAENHVKRRRFERHPGHFGRILERAGLCGSDGRRDLRGGTPFSHGITSQRLPKRLPGNGEDKNTALWLVALAFWEILPDGKIESN